MKKRIRNVLILHRFSKFLSIFQFFYTFSQFFSNFLRLFDFFIFLFKFSSTTVRNILIMCTIGKITNNNNLMNASLVTERCCFEAKCWFYPTNGSSDRCCFASGVGVDCLQQDEVLHLFCLVISKVLLDFCWRRPSEKRLDFAGDWIFSKCFSPQRFSRILRLEYGLYSVRVR